MKEKELNAFLASVRRTRFVDYLDPLGETAQNALERRLSWARVSQHDPAYAEEARFLLDNADGLREILRGELEQDDWVEEASVGSEWEAGQAPRRVAESARVTEFFQAEPGGRTDDTSGATPVSRPRTATPRAANPAPTARPTPTPAPRGAPAPTARATPPAGARAASVPTARATTARATPAGGARARVVPEATPAAGGRTPRADKTTDAGRPVAQASQNSRTTAAADGTPLVTIDDPATITVAGDERHSGLVTSNPRAPDDTGFDDWEEDQMPTGIMQVEDITDPALQNAFRSATAKPTREILAGTGKVGPIREDEAFSPDSAPDRKGDQDIELRTAPSAVTRSRKPGETPAPAGTARATPGPAPLDRSAAAKAQKAASAASAMPKMKFETPAARPEGRRGVSIAVVALGLVLVVLLLVGVGVVAVPVLLASRSEVAIAEPVPAPVEPAPVVEPQPAPEPVVEAAAVPAPVEPAPVEPAPVAPEPVAAAPSPKPARPVPGPRPAPVKPEPKPAPEPVAAAPEPAAPEPKPAPAPEPVAAAPEPVAPEPAVAAVEPEPAAPAAPALDIQGTWFGSTDGGRSFKLDVLGQTGGDFEGTVNVQLEDGTFTDVAVSGSVNADGGVSFRGGDAKFSGKVSGKSAGGSYTISGASGSWSVVR